MTHQFPVTRCLYCGSEDIGRGWQHGEALVTFRKTWTVGQPPAVPALSSLWRGAVSVRGRAAQISLGRITLRPRRSCCA